MDGVGSLPPARRVRARPRQETVAAASCGARCDTSRARSLAHLPLGDTPGSQLVTIVRPRPARGTAHEVELLHLVTGLPGGRHLLEGTGIDLANDVDLIAALSPEIGVGGETSLAARHHLENGALRSALERGATQAGGVLAWRTGRGGEIGEASRGAASDGDRRFISFPTDDLVLIVPRGYRSPFVGSARRRITGASAIEPNGLASPPAPRAPAAVPAPADRPAAPVENQGWIDFLGRVDDLLAGPLADVLVVLAGTEASLGSPAGAARRPLGTPDGAGAVALGSSGVSAPTAVLALPVPRASMAAIRRGGSVDVQLAFADESAARTWEDGWSTVVDQLPTAPPFAFATTALRQRSRLIRTTDHVSIHVTFDHSELSRLLLALADVLAGHPADE